MSWTADEYARNVISGRAFRENWIENYGEDPYTGEQVEPWEVPANGCEAAVVSPVMGLLGGVILLCAIVGGMIFLVIRALLWVLEMCDVHDFWKKIHKKESHFGYQVDAPLAENGGDSCESRGV
ncbi:MAG: hypothetical protein AB1510_04600 [Bacillota bacterium]